MPTERRAHKKIRHPTPFFRDVALAAHAVTSPSSRRRNGTAPEMPQKSPRLVVQETATDCGAACLAMILSAYRRSVSLKDIRESLGVLRDGVTAQQIVVAARTFGLRGQGLRVDLADLPSLRVPAILHWDFNHFIVLTRIRRGKAEILDPVGRRVSVNMQELSRAFTGVAIIFEPWRIYEHMGGERSFWTVPLTWLYESRSLLFLIALVTVGLQGLGLILPLFTVYLVNRVIPQRALPNLSIFLLAVLLYISSYAIVALSRGMLLLRLQLRITKRSQEAFLEHLLSLRFSFFQLRSAGDLIMRLSSNNIVQGLLSGQVLSLATDGILTVIYFIAMLGTNVPLSFLVLSVAILELTWAAVSIWAMHDPIREEVAAQSRGQSYLVEVLRGIETVKALGVERDAYQTWRNLFDEQLATSLLSQRRGVLLGSMNVILGMGFPVLFLFVGCTFVVHASLSLGVMLGLSSLAGAFLAPMRSISTHLEGFQTMGTHLSRMQDILEEPPESQKPALLDSLEGQIEMRNVSFRYGRHSPWLFRNVNVYIKAGSLVVIAGPSGSGKSSLAKVLLGLYAPTEGEVLWDNVSLSQLDLSSVRSNTGVVVQNAFLFNNSIRNNLSVGNPHMPLAQIQRAARIACISQDIEQMPMGYDTILSEMASNISGGQRQRLCLARALARDPKVLLLDEATSEVGKDVESHIMRNLLDLRCTKIIVTHNPGAIEGADLVLVMSKGEVLVQTHVDKLEDP